MTNAIDRRHQTTIQSISMLLKAHDITSLKSLKAACLNNREFMAEWLAIWQDCARNNGGKLSLG
ncbi:hypothetical protein BIZ37_29875, partial [Photobacterium sp. BZF1]|uniref:hypothetical protein n=1 Tax=Photobacterium sp. BZF1 TaxID=1904457 RepID=UPI001653665E